MLFDAKRRELNKEKREVLENLQLKYDNAATAAEQSNRDDLEKLESDISHAVEQNEQAFAREMAKIWTPVSDALTLLKKAASAIDGTIVEELPQYNLVDESVSNEFALHDVGDMLDVTVELTGVE